MVSPVGGDDEGYRPAVPIAGVVFDYFGTLSISTSRATRRAGASRVAAALGIPADEFIEATQTTFTERATGSCGDLRETMRWLAQRCGRTPSAAELETACRIRRDTEAGYIRTIRADAEPTLRALKERNLRIGVLSDCTHELPELWPTLPIARHVDAAVFSVEAGLRKPHPDLYAMVASRLDVDPTNCLYVGDGGSGELTGATEAGMTAYHLVTPDATGALVYDADSAWEGPVITRLAEVVALTE